MVQKLVPIADLSDRGVGVVDLQAALAAATEVDLQFVNTGDLVLFVDNQSAGVRTVTLTATPDPFGRAVDEVIAIPAGEVGFFPFMSPSMFSTGGGGVANVTLDAFATTNVGIYRLFKNG